MMSSENRHGGPFSTGGRAVAEEGQVLLDGPDGVAIAMTPDAAEETAASLLAAAKEARRQAPAKSADEEQG
jgi:hypothetical protein